ncbi:MAG: sensor histidine kinase [Candidatus Thorarchaeota archaeon]
MENQEVRSKGKLFFEIILGLPWILTRPSSTIENEGTKRKARFLRITLLTAICVFPLLQIISNPIPNFPIYAILTIAIAFVYLLSGTEHIRLSSAITIITAASIPFIILILVPVWSRASLTFQVISWPVIASLIGSQLISTRKMTFLVGLMNAGLLIIIIYHPGINNREGLEAIGVAFLITVFLLITSWTQQYYSQSLTKSNRDLEAKRKELEMYTRILRHDLGNDIQMVLGGIELSQMSEGEFRQKAHLESTLAAAERMRSLLQMISLTEAELDLDIVTVLEKIAQRAEIAFKGMIVTIKAAEDVKENPPKYGRLVAIAFENLLRNSAQHAGDRPKVEIMISSNGDSLEILFGDDGPGIDPEIRRNLFEKGTTSGEPGKGMGLYLTKSILESEKGSIQLIKDDHPGCHFFIILPLFNGR